MQFVFSILKSKVTGNSKVTYDDITVGLPALLICIESVVFLVAFHFVFNAREYRGAKEEVNSAHGVAQALLDALNPMDLLRAIGQAFTLTGSRKSG